MISLSFVQMSIRVLMEYTVVFKDAETHNIHTNALAFLVINFWLIVFHAQVYDTDRCLFIGT